MQVPTAGREGARSTEYGGIKLEKRPLRPKGVDEKRGRQKSTEHSMELFCARRRSLRFFPPRQRREIQFSRLHAPDQGNRNTPQRILQRRDATRQCDTTVHRLHVYEHTTGG